MQKIENEMEAGDYIIGVRLSQNLGFLLRVPMKRTIGDYRVLVSTLESPHVWTLPKCSMQAWPNLKTRRTRISRTTFQGVHDLSGSMKPRRLSPSSNSQAGMQNWNNWLPCPGEQSMAIFAIGIAADSSKQLELTPCAGLESFEHCSVGEPCRSQNDLHLLGNQREINTCTAVEGLG